LHACSTNIRDEQKNDRGDEAKSRQQVKGCSNVHGCGARMSALAEGPGPSAPFLVTGVLTDAVEKPPNEMLRRDQ